MRSAEDRAIAWAQRPRLDPELEARFFAGLEEAERFFSGESDVKLPAELVEELDPYVRYVREKYDELWRAAQAVERE